MLDTAADAKKSLPEIREQYNGLYKSSSAAQLREPNQW